MHSRARIPISRPPCLDHATARVQVDADPRDATSKQGERTASARFNFSGRVVLISGEFDLIEPPNRIAYSWQVEPAPAEASRVIVSFLARGRRTEVVVTHERIASKAIRDDHRLGWRGCLKSLAAYMRSPRDW
jgi:uncharacterized protein YndB with AHSA1/START domain